jgi:hypothetical protein
MSIEQILLDRQSLINRLRVLEDIIERSGIWECNSCGAKYAGCPPQAGLQSTICTCGGGCSKKAR